MFIYGGPTTWRMISIYIASPVNISLVKNTLPTYENYRLTFEPSRHVSTNDLMNKPFGSMVTSFTLWGGWITTDLNFHYYTSERYLNELELPRHIGLNSIQVLGGRVAESNEFYD